VPVSALAHSAICVDDIDAAVAWYRDVLGLKVLSPPYRMAGPSIEADMGELVPAPVVVEAAILGFEESDHVVELISYPEAPAPAGSADGASLTRPGISHLGLLCDDVARTRRELEAKGVQFLTTAPASVAGLHTTWLRDPWGARWILLDKRHPERPYWRQFPPAE
jgi:catechol 2,3-dioxygenase-like lactoylglutathione lyase family enzyme